MPPDHRETTDLPADSRLSQLRSSQLMGPLALVGASLIFGGAYTVMKQALETTPSLLLLASEYCFASVVLLPLVGKALLRTPRSVLAKAVFMGALWLAAAWLLFVGLRTITPGLSAFIVIQISVITPILVGLTGGGWFGWRLGASIAVVMAGMALIFLWGESVALSIGVATTFACAMLLAVHIMVLGQLTHRANALVLVLVQSAVTGIGALLLSLLLEAWPPVPQGFDRSFVIAVLYGGLGSSLVAFLLQTLGQRRTPVSYVGLFLSLEAVFALIISILAGMESLDRRTGVGFGIVFAGTLLAQAGLRRRAPRAVSEASGGRTIAAGPAGAGRGDASTSSLKH